MTATGHAIIGTVIAAKIGNPALAIPIALASHVVADAIPHWDLATNGGRKKGKKLIYESFFDVLIGFVSSFIILGLFFPNTNIGYAFFIVLVSQFFDWLMVPYYFLNINIPPFNWAYRFQKLFDNEMNKPWGIIYQAGFVTAILIAGIVL